MYAQECREQGFIGADFDIQQDLSCDLPEVWREFNKEFIPIYLQANPDKSKIADGRHRRRGQRHRGGLHRKPNDRPNPGRLEFEIQTLKELEQLSRKVVDQRTDAKWQELDRILDDPLIKLPNGARRKLVLFTEFKDTLMDLAAKIPATVWDGRRRWRRSTAVWPAIDAVRLFMPS